MNSNKVKILKGFNLTYTLLICLLFLFSCEQETKLQDGNEAVIKIVDDSGKELWFTQKPTTVIALAPNINEILFQLIDVDNILARTHYCNYPVEILSKKVVTTYPTIDIEKLLVFQPDLVIAKRDMMDPRVIHELEKMGLKILLQDYEPIDSMLSSILELGYLFDQEDRAHSIVNSVKNRINRIHDKTKLEVKPTVLCLIDHELYAYGQNTLMQEKIQIAGGDGVILEDQPLTYPKLTQEYILQLNPDYILMDRVDTTLLWRNYPHLKLLKAYKKQNIFFINTDLASRPSPRVVESIEEIYNILHNEN